MNADRLLALYDRVADAPDAIDRLRRFMLDLAVRGLLVAQDPTDEPASELLKRIAAENARRASTGRARGRKAVHLQMAPPPFALPRTWCWASLGALFQYDAGTKCDPKALDTSAWLLDLRDIEKGTGRLLNRVRASERKSKSTKSRFLPGDVLYGKLRPYLNKVIVADETGYSTTEIVAIRPYLQLSSEYCALALRCPDFVDYVTRLGQGTKMPRLRTKDAVVAPFPLPPLAEQRRIVAKADELFALCDRLEEKRVAREDSRDRLTQASLARLSAAGIDEVTYRAHARFAVDALPALTARADQIKQMRQTILNLAFHGKLVPQDPRERFGRDVLARIMRTDPSPSRTGSSSKTIEDMHPLPSSWTWASLGQLITAGPRNGLSPRASARKDAPRAVTLTATTSGVFDGSHFKRVDAHIAPDSKYWLQPNDLLFQRGNTPEYVGMAAIYDGPPGEFIFPDLMIRVRLAPEVNLRFVHLFCLSPVARNYFSENATGAQKSMPKINQAVLRALPIPVPPISEQHRIVAMLEKFMALCDRMEAGLDTTDGNRTRRLISLLQEPLAASKHPMPAPLAGATEGFESPCVA